jgi:plasmid stabilization system protein ParE
MRVELRVEARRDLVEAAGFYEQQREGLGAYFIDRVFEDLKRLEREGGIHEQIFGLHRKLSRRFPYAIYYRIDESVIDVVAVLDCRRDPNSISERLTRRSG